MRRVAAIVTDQGGRTAHAAIVSREFGIPCIVGTGNATARSQRPGGDQFAARRDRRVMSMPAGFRSPSSRSTRRRFPRPTPRSCSPLAIPARPSSSRLFPMAASDCARTEFIITNHIGIHPMALCRFPKLQDQGGGRGNSKRIGNEDAGEFFIRRFSEGVARIAAAFYPKPVIVRTSDFKTNEYARLIGGKEFEPTEENPMLGYRGASRYYHPGYAEGFALECAALARVGSRWDSPTSMVMIPFCRTVEEGEKVIDAMRINGLARVRTGCKCMRCASCRPTWCWPGNSSKSSMAIRSAPTI